MISLLLFTLLSAPPDYEVGVVYFTSPKNCQFCRQMEPTIARLQQDGIAVWIVDVNKNLNYARAYGVNRIPTSVVVVVTMENGVRKTRVADQYVGLHSLSILRNALRRANPFSLYVPTQSAVRVGGS